MTLLGSLLWGTFIVALLVASWRPWVVASAFLLLVSPTSSLPWQLGSVNVSLPFVLLLGLVSGLVVRSTRQARVRFPRGDHLRTVAVATLVTILAATALSLSRELAPQSVSIVVAQDLWPSVWRFNPAGVPGQVQAALTMAVAPLLMLFGQRVRHRPRVLVAALLGFAVLVVAPLLQLPFLETLMIRPDRERYLGTGIVGFMQDPHSYAAALLLGIGCLGGSAYSLARTGRKAMSTLLACLGLVGVVTLVLTGSRGGQLTLLGMIAMPLLTFLAGPRALRSRWRTSMSVIGMAVLLAVGWGVVSAGRIGRPIAVGSEGTPSTVALREVSWSKAAHLVVQHPLWGVGPGRFANALVDMDNPAPETVSEADFIRSMEENAHNYFLQVAAEIGVPGLICYSVLFLLGLVAVARAARRASAPWISGFAHGLLAGQVGILVFSMVSHPLLLPEIQGDYWLLTAIIIGVEKAPDPSAG